jgi:hypothetical protein
VIHFEQTAGEASVSVGSPPEKFGKEIHMANIAVYGIYKDRVHVEIAVDTLRREGFRK